MKSSSRTCYHCIHKWGARYYSESLSDYWLPLIFSADKERNLLNIGTASECNRKGGNKIFKNIEKTSLNGSDTIATCQGQKWPSKFHSEGKTQGSSSAPDQIENDEHFHMELSDRKRKCSFYLGDILSKTRITSDRLCIWHKERFLHPVTKKPNAKTLDQIALIICVPNITPKTHFCIYGRYRRDYFDGAILITKDEPLPYIDKLNLTKQIKSKYWNSWQIVFQVLTQNTSISSEIFFCHQTFFNYQFIVW